jgi:hypothetical protein
MIGHRPADKRATVTLSGLAAVNIKLDTVTTAAQHTGRQGPIMQGRALMRAAVFEQQVLALVHDKQQASAAYLKGTLVAFVQVDQAFQGYKHDPPL